MKKCDFCVHKCRTQFGEDVCIKRLYYIGEIVPEPPCFDFTLDIKTKTVAICLVSLVITLSILAIAL